MIISLWESLIISVSVIRECYNDEVKKLLIIAMLLVFSACSNSYDVKKNLDEIFDDTTSLITVRQNNYSTYMDYYLPSDMEEVECTKEACIFSFRDSYMILNINASDIINSQYYSDEVLSDDGFFSEEKLFYSIKGQYRDHNDELHEFFFKGYEIDECYLLQLKSIDVNIYGYASKKDAGDLAKKMLLMCRSVSVKRDSIVALYSSKDVIDYEKTAIDLFEYIVPVNGQLDELLPDDLKQVQEETAEDEILEELEETE